MAATMTKLLGIAFGNEAAEITFKVSKDQDNGLDIIVMVKMLEYEFSVKTFYYGFNLASFINQLEKISEACEGSATLTNYDQSLTLEFMKTGIDYSDISILYKSILPEQPADAAQRMNRSCRENNAIYGTVFELHHLKIVSPLSTLGQSFRHTIEEHALSTDNPYL